MLNPIVILISIGFFYLVYRGFLIESKEREVRNKAKESQEIQNKLNLQNFILACQAVHPSYSLKIFDRIASFEGPLRNSKSKAVGKIIVSGNYNISYSKNEPYINMYIHVVINDKGYRVDRKFIRNDQQILKKVLAEIWEEVMQKEDLKKRIIATTY